MTKKLTDDEWFKAAHPIFCVKVKAADGWSELEKQVVDKWLDESVSSWWYEYKGTFAFPTDEDRVAFVLWLRCKPFSELTQEI